MWAGAPPGAEPEGVAGVAGAGVQAVAMAEGVEGGGQLGWELRWRGAAAGVRQGLVIGVCQGRGLHPDCTRRSSKHT